MLKVGLDGQLLGSLWIPMVPVCLAAIFAPVFSDLGLAAFDEIGMVASVIIVMKNQGPSSNSSQSKVVLGQ